MKLAFTTLGCPGWNLAQVIDAAQRYGYEGLELRLLDGSIIQPDLPVETRRQVLAECRKAHLPIVCVDTSVRVARLDQAEREMQTRDGMAMLELAAHWESPFIRVFGDSPEGAEETDAVNCASETLSHLARRGEQLGVTVLLETHDTFAAGRRVARALSGVRGAGALWDTLHPCRMGETPHETLQALGDTVRHVHIKDGCRSGDTWKLVLLGEGDVPLLPILSALKQHGYAGWLAVEWEKYWHPELADPEIALPQHIAVLREYLERG